MDESEPYRPFLLRVVCPACRHELNRGDGLAPGQVPEPGDVMFCNTCGFVSLLDPDLQARRPSRSESFYLDQSMDLSAVRRAWRMNHPTSSP